MKTMTKKLGAVILALAMCFSLCCVAFAADGDDPEPQQFTITVDPAYSGEIYTAYKIFDATYDGDAISYSISSDSPWYAQVNAAPTVFKLTEITGLSTEEETVYQVTRVDGATDDQIIDVLKTIPENAVEAASATAPASTKEDGSTEKTTVDLDVSESGAGYYYVTTSLGSAVAINSAAPDVTVSDKNEPPTFEKKVDYVDSESSENQKTVNYEFTINNVHGIHHLVLEDKMDVAAEEVTYLFIFNTLTVQLIDGTTTTTLTLGTDYTVLWGEETGDDCDFHVVFEVGENEYDFSNCSDDAYVYITVDCELDANGAVFQDDDFDIPNEAVVTFGNGGKTTYDRADVYEYAIHVFKYTGDIDDNPTALEGAHFTLTNASGQVAYFEVNSEGAYLLEGWADDVASVPTTNYVYDLVSAADGYFKIDGLGEATYTLTETQAPDGYNLLTEPIVFTIAATDDQGGFTVNGNAYHTIDVENNAGSALPSTGGIGTTIFYIIGGVLVVGAVVVLVTRRRMTREG